jgi:GDPmannose 4,6-dehydratase
LRLGNLSIERDWGWAPEYVEAMWLMLQQESARDYVIATGEANKLADFVDAAFSQANLDWKEFVEVDRTLLRPTDITRGVGDPSLAARDLGWRAKHRMRDVVRLMLEAESARG